MHTKRLKGVNEREYLQACPATGCNASRVIQFLAKAEPRHVLLSLYLPQVHLAFDIFVLSGVLDELGIPESELSGFLSGLSAHYHSPEDVPYHNLAHVVQVLHTVWLVSIASCTP